MGALTLARDLRVGLRSWRRTPAVAATAVLTLALGIGASTTIFSVVHPLLVRSLPYREAERLVVVRAEQDFEGASRPVRVQFPSDAVAAWPRQTSTLADVGFYTESVGALAQPTGSALVNTAIVTGRFFETLDGPLVMGRALAPADDATPAVVISARLWRRHFAGRDGVLGRAVIVNGQALTVVGVAADGFQFPTADVDVWLTAGTARQTSARCCSFTPVARLAPAVTLESATAELAATTQAIAAQFPRALGDARVQVLPLRDAIVASVRPALSMLVGAVALLLILAVGNVASLLLAKHSASAIELDVRRALGASATRLVREACAASAWLCAAGAALGIALAWGGVRLLHALAADALPLMDAIRVDGWALGFAVAVSVAVTTAVALLPLLAAGDAARPLHPQARGAGAGPRARIALGTITAGQLAISVVLLVAASLLGRSLVALLRVDMGVVPERVATASLNLAMGRTLTSVQQAALANRVVERVSSVPGVVAAGIGTSRPPDASRMRLTLARGTDPRERATYQAAGVPVTPGYFLALGIQLERGRLFTDADGANAPPVVILSGSTARRLFPGGDPVGQRIGLPVVRDGTTRREEMTVVGVARDVKFNGLDQQADDVVYRPFEQQPWVSAFLVVRTAGDADAMAARLAREVAAVDTDIAVSDARSMDAVLAQVTTQPRLRVLVLVAFALLAVLIAAVGLGGVVSYSVSQRRSEMGIRMALGADAARIRGLVLREGLRLSVLGGLVGLAGAVAASRGLSSLLFGVAPTDPVSFGAAVLGVMVVGVFASYLPAARAARTDPATVLRGD